jgi:predicted Fe-Mo cluster-binding NifX family protein
MRIGITLIDSNDMDSKISMHFGQCTHFMIADIEDSKVSNYKIVKNSAMHGGGGCKAVFVVLEENIDTIISGGMGGGAQVKFQNAGVNISSAVGNSAKEVIDHYIANKPEGIKPCTEHDGHC